MDNYSCLYDACFSKSLTMAIRKLKIKGHWVIQTTWMFLSSTGIPTSAKVDHQRPNCYPLTSASPTHLQEISLDFGSLCQTVGTFSFTSLKTNLQVLPEACHTLLVGDSINNIPHKPLYPSDDDPNFLWE